MHLVWPLKFFITIIVSSFSWVLQLCQEKSKTYLRDKWCIMVYLEIMNYANFFIASNILLACHAILPNMGKEQMTKPSTLFSPINKTFQIKNLNWCWIQAHYPLSVYTLIINSSLLILILLQLCLSNPKAPFVSLYRKLFPEHWSQLKYSVVSQCILYLNGLKPLSIN